MLRYISMHSLGEDLVDCRRLQIEFEFFKASQKQLRELAEFCIHSINAWLGDAFILDWRWKNRRVSAATLQLKSVKTNDTCVFHCFGNVKDSPYNDFKQMDYYSQKLVQQLNMSSWDIHVSADYWEVYHQLFNNLSSPEEVRQNLLTLFQMENRYFKQRWIGTDMVSYFTSFPYLNRRDLFFGQFEFRIALPCLGGNVLRFSNFATEFLEKTTAIISEVSGRVTISPSTPPSSCSSYMDYFGGYARYCPLGREKYMHEKEWTNFFFLKGVEWCNLLTPLQTALVENRPYPDNISVTRLPNDGCIVTIRKSIIKVLNSDLCDLKEYLYPVLYPGGIEIPIAALLNPHKKGYIVKPRYQWEDVPVLEDEIKAYPDKIVIEYQTGKLQ